MAVTVTPKRVSASLKLNAGIDPETEKAITKSLSIGTLTIDATNEGVMAVANALKPCIEHEVTSVEYTKVDVLNNVG